MEPEYCPAIFVVDLVPIVVVELSPVEAAESPAVVAVQVAAAMWTGEAADRVKPPWLVADAAAVCGAVVTTRVAAASGPCPGRAVMAAAAVPGMAGWQWQRWPQEMPPELLPGLRTHRAAVTELGSDEAAHTQGGTAA